MSASAPITGSSVKSVEVKHVYKSFGENEVLKDFGLELYKGENLVVIGRSGSGKSVLIKCIAGLLKPDSGEILVFGENVPALKQRALDRIRLRIGFLFQGSALYDSMTVEENLLFPLRNERKSLSRREVEKKVAEALENVGLPGTGSMMPSELSGGMKKRIGLARAIIRNPEIVLYDEPTAGLDPITGKEISRLIVQIQERYNTSSIIITHDTSCAHIAGNRIAMLINGVCYKTGSYEEMKRSDNPEIKEFFE